MATIKFFIQSEKNPAGIYVRLRDGVNIDAKAKTNYSVNPLDWIDNTKKNNPESLFKYEGLKEKPKTESLKKLHGQLVKFKSSLLDQYNDESNKSLISSQWLKDFINPTDKESETVPNALILYCEYYITHQKSSIMNSSYQKLNVIKQLLIRFQKDQKRVFFIRDVNLDFVLKFQQYCDKEKYSHNTISRAIKFIKSICYHAAANKIETSHQLKAIKVKLKPVDKIFLTLDDIVKIEEKELEHDYLDNARDWLLISCETGQRVSDFMRFRAAEIREEEGRKFIDFTQVKTGKEISLPLTKRVLRILDKRNGEFPRQISDQRYNEFIKKVGELAGLTYKVKGSKKDPETERKVSGTFPKFELISSHIGRRSFATNNYSKVPTSLLIKASGHSSERMFLEYIGKADDNSAKELAKYF